MAFLTPDSMYTANGLVVKQRIIPFGIKSSKDIWSGGKIILAKGDRFKADNYLKTPNHKPKYITVHNTDNINPAKGTTKSEQYSRATYPNENMGTSRIHYYVCEKEAWQNLLDTEIGWHVSYSLNAIANDQSISIEIIGSDAKAEDNGAKLVAFLMKKYNIPIQNVRTHNSWSGKYCPCWILPHWDDFIDRVLEIYEKNPSNKKEETKERAVRYIVESLGKAAIRTSASKEAEILGRVFKDGLYAIDRILVNNKEEQWLKHWKENKYSMYEDGQILFRKIDEFVLYSTKVKINIRSKPSLSGEILAEAPANTKLCAFADEKPIKADGYNWIKIVYNNKIAYAALEYLKKGA